VDKREGETPKEVRLLLMRRKSIVEKLPNKYSYRTLVSSSQETL
jgi:hypothetical protein